MERAMYGFWEPKPVLCGTCGAFLAVIDTRLATIMHLKLDCKHCELKAKVSIPLSLPKGGGRG